MSEIDLVLDGDEAFVNGELLGFRKIIDGNIINIFAYTDIEIQFLKNSIYKLSALEESGFTPKPYGFSAGDFTGKLSLEYLSKSEPVTDEITFRRNCALLLWILKKHGIRHGDITTKNIIVKNNKPMLIDFHQSKFDHESGPDKRPEGDAYNLWEAALELSPDTSRHIRKWRAIRPFVQGGKIFDWGCAEGDYCLLSISENPDCKVLGYDTDDRVIRFANKHWSKYGCSFSSQKIPAIPGKMFFDTIFFMSVFAHMAKQNEPMVYHMDWMSRHSRQLFFETQLYGDGPGPEFFKTDDDVFKFLKQFGKVEKLVTIPVYGRDASRTVWRII